MATGSNPITALYKPRVFQDVETLRFYDSPHMKVIRPSALGTGRLEPPLEIVQLLISIRRRVDARTIVWPDGLCQ